MLKTDSYFLSRVLKLHKRQIAFDKYSFFLLAVLRVHPELTNMSLQYIAGFPLLL